MKKAYEQGSYIRRLQKHLDHHIITLAKNITFLSIMIYKIMYHGKSCTYPVAIAIPKIISGGRITNAPIVAKKTESFL